MSGWSIRPLEAEDLPLFRPLRLRALRDHPEAFGSSFEEEQDDDMARWIGSKPNVTLAAFAADVLVATAGLVVSAKLKQRHKGQVVGVYVAPDWRGTGLARDLLNRLITEARHARLLMLTLTVAVRNEPARQLYRRVGFEAYGMEPRSLMVDGVAWDEELMVLPLA